MLFDTPFLKCGHCVPDHVVLYPCVWTGFRRKEFRGKLAIAITANFKNRNTTAEAKVEEISGVAFIFNQRFFQELRQETGLFLKVDTHLESAFRDSRCVWCSPVSACFRDWLGEYCVLQRRHTLFCDDGKETESIGKRSNSAGNTHTHLESFSIYPSVHELSHEPTPLLLNNFSISRWISSKTCILLSGSFLTTPVASPMKLLLLSLQTFFTLVSSPSPWPL